MVVGRGLPVRLRILRIFVNLRETWRIFVKLCITYSPGSRKDEAHQGSHRLTRGIPQRLKRRAFRCRDPPLEPGSPPVPRLTPSLSPFLPCLNFPPQVPVTSLCLTHLLLPLYSTHLAGNLAPLFLLLLLISFQQTGMGVGIDDLRGGETPRVVGIAPIFLSFDRLFLSRRRSKNWGRVTERPLPGGV